MRQVVVTGGGTGIGLAVASEFVRAGDSVTIAGRREHVLKEAADRLTTAAERSWGPAGYACFDASDPAAVSAALELLPARVDVLVNNAGLSPLYPSLTEISEALYDKVFAVNLKGPFRLSTLIGERMAEAGSGAIINISSVEAASPSPGALPYAAAKAGLDVLTLGLARAYGPAVRVNSIMAGPFLTDISKAWDLDAVTAGLQHSSALRRVGRPEEIVGAALYLASLSASFTTGSTIRVDGGAFGPLF